MWCPGSGVVYFIVSFSDLCRLSYFGMQSVILIFLRFLVIFNRCVFVFYISKHLLFKIIAYKDWKIPEVDFPIVCCHDFKLETTKIPVMASEYIII